MLQDTPEEATRRFAACVGRGDLDGAGEIFEAGATVISDVGAVVSGRAAISEILAAFVASRTALDVRIDRVIYVAEDLAVVYNQWLFRGLEPDGAITPNAGASFTLLRRHADGLWRLAFSNVDRGGLPADRSARDVDTLLSRSGSVSQVPESPDACARAFADGISRGDLERVLALFDEAATFVEDDGNVLTGREAIRAVIAPFLSPAGTRRMEILRVFPIGTDLAVVYNEWRLALPESQGSVVPHAGAGLQILRRRASGEWRVVCDDPTRSAGDA